MAIAIFLGVYFRYLSPLRKKILSKFKIQRVQGGFRQGVIFDVFTLFSINDEFWIILMWNVTTDKM